MFKNHENLEVGTVNSCQVETKKCKFCNKTKQLTEFRNFHNVFSINCIECLNEKESLKIQNLKRCAKCKIVKDIDKFHGRINSKHSVCKECNKLDQQLRRNKNTNKDFSLVNAEKRCEICREVKKLENFCRHINGYYRSYCKVCYETRISAEKHEQDITSKEKRRANERSKYRKNPKLAMWRSAKARAKKQNVPFSITLDDIIIPEYCPILGIKIISGIGNSTNNSPTLDKIIPKLGYVRGNIKVISWRANALKRDGTVEEFENIIRYIKENS